MNTRDHLIQNPMCQRCRLADWLLEWHMQQRLASTLESGEIEDSSSVAVTDAENRREAPADPLQVPLGTATPLSAGQIRLMTPDGDGSRDAPRYVLMLAPLTAATWIVVPFGRFVAAAIPGEWQTGLRSLVIRVLCLWNARETPSARMYNSWYVRRLDTVRRRQALRLTADCFLLAETLRSSLVRQAAGQAPPPPSSMGPPLLHPLDPRHAYLNSETVAMESLGSSLGRAQGDVCWRGDPMPGVGRVAPLPYPVGGDSVYLKAAEPKSDYLENSGLFDD